MNELVGKTPSVSRYWKVFAAIPFISLMGAPEAKCESELSGSWHGGGTVVYSSGERERARCNVRYSGSGSRVSFSATCATPSGSISQDGTLRKTGANRYSGTFHNSDYNVSGNIDVVVNGNTQHVSLSSESASASLSLRR